MAYLPADAVELLRTLVLEVRALRQRLEAADARVATGAQSALIAAVFAVAGRRRCLTRELRDMASRPGVPERALQAILFDGKNNHAAGCSLGDAAGRPCADTGLVLTKVSSKRGTVWGISDATKSPNR
jgi:hypothetical protein